VALEAVGLVRGFLTHVLPSGFVRLRHYGILANCDRRVKLARCRELLGEAALDDGIADTRICRGGAVDSWPAARLRPAWSFLLAMPSNLLRCGCCGSVSSAHFAVG
jgi:hypothetical protein